jgi:hypothetical protein
LRKSARTHYRAIGGLRQQDAKEIIESSAVSGAKFANYRYREIANFGPAALEREIGSTDTRSRHAGGP